MKVGKLLCNRLPPGIFLLLDNVLVYWIELDTIGLLYSIGEYQSVRIIARVVFSAVD